MGPRTLCINSFPGYPLFFSCSVLFNSLWPYGLQHPRLPCALLSPRVCSISCPLGQWYHPNISASVAPFSSCPQSFPASGTFPVSWLFMSGGQSIRASALASVLSVNIQGWLPLVLSGLISLLSKGLARIFSSTTVRKQQFFSAQLFFIIQLLHPYVTTGKTIVLNRWTFVGKVMSLLYNMLSSLVITFLPRSKRLLISWLQSPSAVILSPKK